jgi:hypothetical protein
MHPRHLRKHLQPAQGVVPLLQVRYRPQCKERTQQLPASIAERQQVASAKVTKFALKLGHASMWLCTSYTCAM